MDIIERLVFHFTVVDFAVESIEKFEVAELIGLFCAVFGHILQVLNMEENSDIANNCLSIDIINK